MWLINFWASMTGAGENGKLKMKRPMMIFNNCYIMHYLVILELIMHLNHHVVFGSYSGVSTAYHQFYRQRLPTITTPPLITFSSPLPRPVRTNYYTIILSQYIIYIIIYICLFHIIHCQYIHPDTSQLTGLSRDRLWCWPHWTIRQYGRPESGYFRCFYAIFFFAFVGWRCRPWRFPASPWWWDLQDQPSIAFTTYLRR